jgi:hypothetical protein
MRRVTNSPGVAGVPGGEDENRTLDLLTPHTTRRGAFWETAPAEIGRLLERCRSSGICAISRLVLPKGHK